MPSLVSKAGAEQDDPARTLEELKRELAEAREQQAATAEILAAISSSPTGLHRIFAEIAAAAARLCDGYNAGIFRLDGENLRLVAHHGPIPAVGPVGDGTLALTPGLPPARAVLDRQTVHVADLQAETTEYPEGSDFARQLDFHAALSVPLMRAGEAIGVITIRRTDARPFTERQIAVLKAFADQAVIAIENTRLFQEVRQRTTDLSEALERQTATSEVLSLISSSPGELEPVFKSMLENAVRLCSASFGMTYVAEGDAYRVVAMHGVPEAYTQRRTREPIFRPPPGGHLDVIRRTKQPEHVADITTLEPYAGSVIAGEAGARTLLTVPLLRDDEVIGAINIYRKEVQPFTDKQIELLSDFAKQAVIAIENTRLFEAEQASKRELQESLEYQTAISDVLGVISASPSDVRPAYQNIVETACRLCRADRAAVWRLVEGGFQVVARANDTGPPARFAGITPIDRDSLAGRVGLEGRTVHIPDILADPDYHKFRSRAGDDRRSMLGVPLMRQQQVIGAIILVRTRLEPFGHAEIRLVETFADQAVIAIENAQLFEEVEQKNAALNAANSQLTESLEQQTATSEVLEVISSSPGELEPVFQVMLSNAVRICEARFGLLFRYEDGAFGAVASIGVPSKYGDYIQQRGAFRAASHAPLGRLAIAQQPIHIPDLKAYPSYVDGLPSMRAMADLGGARTLLVVPMLKEDNLMGAISIYRTEVRPFTDKQIELVQNFASQAVIAIENTRLLNELRESLRQLEIASQHKSQFVANMSHELRTPLAAILGYAELMQEGFYEPLGEKSLDALTRIRSNGKHLLGLINTVLDIAKIESGQFNLSLGEYAIGNVVETVRAATESLAETKKLALKTDVARSLPIGFGDEQRLTQVLLNLVGNAIKFTDAGEVRITARAENGHFWVSVADTGPGIPADQLTRVFEQFHQVDNSNTKKTGGTGLGLAIAKQIVEMHGGRVWVESALGKGATFQMQLPIRAEYRKAAAE